MSFPAQTVICHYRYDAQNRLVGHALSDKPTHRRFYCKSRLATDIQGALHHSIIQYDDQLLAQLQHQDNNRDTTLIATDLQRSVLSTLQANQQQNPIAYTPYGHRAADNGLTSLLGFNGERADLVTGHYLLGNGYRAFNPALMRFNSPDSMSPFGKGGLNSYTYCLGDPINGYDPNGQATLSVPLAIKVGLWAQRGKAMAAYVKKAKSNAVLPIKADELKFVTRTRTINLNTDPGTELLRLKHWVNPELAILMRDRHEDLTIAKPGLNDNRLYLNKVAAAVKNNEEMRRVLKKPHYKSEEVGFLNFIKEVDGGVDEFDYDLLNKLRFNEHKSFGSYQKLAMQFYGELDKSFSDYSRPLILKAMKIRGKYFE